MIAFNTIFNRMMQFFDDPVLVKILILNLATWFSSSEGTHLIASLVSVMSLVYVILRCYVVIRDEIMKK